MNAFEYRQDKTMCEFSAYVVTKRQTDIKHEKDNTSSLMSLLKMAVEMLPPWRSSSLENHFAHCFVLSTLKNRYDFLPWKATLSMEVTRRSSEPIRRLFIPGTAVPWN